MGHAEAKWSSLTYFSIRTFHTFFIFQSILHLIWIILNRVLFRNLTSSQPLRWCRNANIQDWTIVLYNYTNAYISNAYVCISILHIYIIYPFILSGFRIQPFPFIFPEIASPLGGWSQDGTMLGWSTFIPYTGNGVSRSLVVRQRLVVVKAFCQLFCSACSYLLMPFFCKAWICHVNSATTYNTFTRVRWKTSRRPNLKANLSQPEELELMIFPFSIIILWTKDMPYFLLHQKQHISQTWEHSSPTSFHTIFSQADR